MVWLFLLLGRYRGFPALVAQFVELVVVEVALVLPTLGCALLPDDVRPLVVGALSRRALPHSTCMPLELLKLCTSAQQEHRKR